MFHGLATLYRLYRPWVIYKVSSLVIILGYVPRVVILKLSSLVVILDYVPWVIIPGLPFIGVHPWIIVPGYQSYFDLLQFKLGVYYSSISTVYKHSLTRKMSYDDIPLCLFRLKSCKVFYKVQTGLTSLTLYHCLLMQVSGSLALLQA